LLHWRLLLLLALLLARAHALQLLK